MREDLEIEKKKAWCIPGTDNFNTTKAHRIMDRMM